MMKMRTNPRNFNASSGLSRLRYHLSPHTFFVVVEFIVFVYLSLVVLVVRIVFVAYCFLEKKKAFSICVFVFCLTIQFGLGV